MEDLQPVCEIPSSTRYVLTLIHLRSRADFQRHVDRFSRSRSSLASHTDLQEDLNLIRKAREELQSAGSVASQNFSGKTMQTLELHMVSGFHLITQKGLSSEACLLHTLNMLHPGGRIGYSSRACFNSEKRHLSRCEQRRDGSAVQSIQNLEEVDGIFTVLLSPSRSQDSKALSGKKKVSS